MEFSKAQLFAQHEFVFDPDDQDNGSLYLCYPGALKNPVIRKDDP